MKAQLVNVNIGDFLCRPITAPPPFRSHFLQPNEALQNLTPNVAEMSAASLSPTKTELSIQSIISVLLEGLTKPEPSIALLALLVSIGALAVAVLFGWKSHRNQVIAANIAATTGLMKEWRELTRTRAVNDAETYLRKAGPTALREQGLDAIQGKTKAESLKHRNTVRKVSHLCDEIALRVMWEEANEDELIAFLGARLSMLWPLYEPLWEHVRELKGGDPLHQAGFQAFAERSYRKNPAAVEAMRINRFLGRNAYSPSGEKCWSPFWLLRRFGLKRRLDHWESFCASHRDAKEDEEKACAEFVD